MTRQLTPAATSRKLPCNPVRRAMLAACALVVLASASPAFAIPLSGMQAWFRADAGVTTNASDFVTSWADQTPSSTETASPNGTFPLLVDGAINGRDAIRFDGNDRLWNNRFATTNPIQGSQMTVFIVASRVAASANTSTATFLQNGQTLDYNNTPGFVLAYEGPASTTLQTFRVAGKSTATNPGNAVPYIFATQFDGTFNTAFLNGLAQTPVASSGAFDIDHIVIGQRYQSGFTAGYNGYVAELIVYNSLLSDSQLNQVGVYLSNKYGIEATYVPEPSTGLLSLVGLVAIRAARRRRRKQTISHCPNVANRPHANGPSFSRVVRHRMAHVLALGMALALGHSAQAATIPPTSGLVLHLDANQINPADANQVAGGDVRQWNDASPQANHASQVVVARRPEYVANGGAAFNNRPIVRFDGSLTFLEASSNASFSLLGHDFAGLTSQSQATVFAVVRTNSTTANQVAVDGATAHFPRVQVQGNNWYVGGNNNSFATGSTAVTTSPTIYASTFDGTQAVAADRLTMAIDGIDQTLSAFNVAPATTTGTVNRMLIGIFSSGAAVWNGDIAEVIIYNRLLSDGELNQVGAYLANKYDIEATYVPEPSTGLLSLLGLVAIRAARRRRK